MPWLHPGKYATGSIIVIIDLIESFQTTIFYFANFHQELTEKNESVALVRQGWLCS